MDSLRQLWQHKPMKTQTVYICEYCMKSFDVPCEAHEVECRLDHERAARREREEALIEPLKNLLLGEKTDDPIGARINGQLFLITSPITGKTIRALSSASELVSTVSKPSAKDAEVINKANSILQT